MTLNRNGRVKCGVSSTDSSVTVFSNPRNVYVYKSAFGLLKKRLSLELLIILQEQATATLKGLQRAGQVLLA